MPEHCSLKVVSLEVVIVNVSRFLEEQDAAF